MNPETLLKQLQWRYATKKFAAGKKIPDATWKVLEQALVLSPSSYGLQPWKFFIVTDPAVRQRLLPVSYGQSQIVDASHLVVFSIRDKMGEDHVDAYVKRTAEVRGVPVESLATFKGMMMRGLIPGAPGFDINLWATNQVYIALGQFLASAAALGIDACPMEGFQPEKYDAILSLPQKGYRSAVLATVGYRAEDDRSAELPKVRFQTEDAVEYI